MKGRKMEMRTQVPLLELLFVDWDWLSGRWIQRRETYSTCSSAGLRVVLATTCSVTCPWVGSGGGKIAPGSAGAPSSGASAEAEFSTQPQGMIPLFCGLSAEQVASLIGVRKPRGSQGGKGQVSWTVRPPFHATKLQRKLDRRKGDD